jgi:ATP-dependent DNA helicase RecG
MNSTPSFPETVFSLPVQYLKGIGPRKSDALKKIGIRDLLDLLFYVPRRYLDRSAVVSIAQLRKIVFTPGGGPAVGVEIEGSYPEVRRDCTVVGEVRSFRVMGAGKGARLVLVLADQTGSMQCVWFGGVQYWKRAFQIGETLAVSGQPTSFGGVLQFVHPDLDRLAPAGAEEEVNWNKMLNTGVFVPLYPSGQELARVGLDSGGFRRIIHTAIGLHLNRFPETLPAEIISARSLLPIRDAIRSAHFPQKQSDIGEALRRLKYEELFLFQLKLALKRRVAGEAPGVAFAVKSSLARRLVDALPFRLTNAQIKVIKEISADMAAPRPMNRLLQGDVGSGKTIVALLSMLIAVDNGYQAAFMAPTEILAEQHFKTLSALLKDIPVTIRLLVGAQRSRLRRDVLEDTRSGGAQIVVGTHAIFEKKVEFQRLGMVVIDEQHRFGVMQRAMVRAKGEHPDVLVMTATPIPRTLSLTLYGDLDVSIIDELPKDRKPVKTILKHEEEKESVYQFVRDQIRAGRQAYFVYPLIEESEKVDLKAATVHFEQLQRTVFPDLRLGLIHGRLAGDEKDQIMREFKERRIDILVATTVIEVGIDIPNASVMVIENAERFGLSQLHQLRGRVGRGSDQSYCILPAKKWVVQRADRLGGEGRRGAGVPGLERSLDEQRLAEKRLAAIAATSNGFTIAETDLELRGPGDFFGTRQSGVPEFRVANILTDLALLEAARSDAFDLVSHDPGLRDRAHRLLADQLRDRFHEDLALLQVG